MGGCSSIDVPMRRRPPLIRLRSIRAFFRAVAARTKPGRRLLGRRPKGVINVAPTENARRGDIYDAQLTPLWAILPQIAPEQMREGCLFAVHKDGCGAWREPNRHIPLLGRNDGYHETVIGRANGVFTLTINVDDAVLDEGKRTRANIAQPHSIRSHRRAIMCHHKVGRTTSRSMRDGRF